MKTLLNKLPYLLILFRFLLAPTILWVAYKAEEPTARLWIVVFIVLGLLSDIFDGIIARYMGVCTVAMRRMDSQTDLIFVMEGLCYGVSFWRFGKETCTHAFLSKLWGVCLLVAFISLIGFGYGGFPLLLAVYWGLFSQLDVILIILLLPKWQNDIPSSYHAYLLRKGKEIKKHKLFN